MIHIALWWMTMVEGVYVPHIGEVQAVDKRPIALEKDDALIADAPAKISWMLRREPNEKTEREETDVVNLDNDIEDDIASVDAEALEEKKMYTVSGEARWKVVISNTDSRAVVPYGEGAVDIEKSVEEFMEPLYDADVAIEVESLNYGFNPRKRLYEEKKEETYIFTHDRYGGGSGTYLKLVALFQHEAIKALREKQHELSLLSSFSELKEKKESLVKNLLEVLSNREWVEGLLQDKKENLDSLSPTLKESLNIAEKEAQARTIMAYEPFKLLLWENDVQVQRMKMKKFLSIPKESNQALMTTMSNLRKKNKKETIWNKKRVLAECLNITKDDGNEEKYAKAKLLADRVAQSPHFDSFDLRDMRVMYLKRETLHNFLGIETPNIYTTDNHVTYVEASETKDGEKIEKKQITIIKINDKQRSRIINGKEEDGEIINGKAKDADGVFGVFFVPEDKGTCFVGIGIHLKSKYEQNLGKDAVKDGQAIIIRNLIDYAKDTLGCVDGFALVFGDFNVYSEQNVKAFAKQYGEKYPGFGETVLNGTRGFYEHIRGDVLPRDSPRTSNFGTKDQADIPEDDASRYFMSATEDGGKKLEGIKIPSDKLGFLPIPLKKKGPYHFVNAEMTGKTEHQFSDFFSVNAPDKAMMFGYLTIPNDLSERKQ